MNLFIGTWHLVAVNFYNANGDVQKFYGQDPHGYIYYDAQGRMSVQIMQRDRPHLPRHHQAEHALEDYQAILRGYVAYFGTYSVDETARTMTHHVQGSLLPDWVGTDLVRNYEFRNNNNLLILSTPFSHLRGDDLRGDIIWERA